MRLKLKLSPNTKSVPFNHLHQLTGVIHKWLGPDNAEHMGASLYSFGWLRKGQPRRGWLDFSHGAEWVISLLHLDAAKRVIAGIQNDSNVAFGMKVSEIQEVDPPAISHEAYFFVDGAILTRNTREDGGRDHLTFQNHEADTTLTRTLQRKLELAGFEDAHLDATVGFDRSFQRARTKLITIKGINYRTSECPVIVKGSYEAIHAAWLFGIGELTGMGLGALK